MAPVWVAFRDLPQEEGLETPLKQHHKPRSDFHKGANSVSKQERVEGQKHSPLEEGYETLEPCIYLTCLLKFFLSFLFWCWDRTPGLVHARQRCT
jgi:hypothetical protein